MLLSGWMGDHRGAGVGNGFSGDSGQCIGLQCAELRIACLHQRHITTDLPVTMSPIDLSLHFWLTN